jgi:integrase
MVHTDKGVNPLYTPVKNSRNEASAVSFLYDQEGQRKYLTTGERRAFLKASAQMSAKVRLFCAVLAYAGARISEVLALKPSSFDQAAGLVVIESLKKRRRGVFRAVPLPRSLIKEILSMCAAEPSNERIWGWSRVTAWTWVKKTMKSAQITGTKASPKGLRHAFGVSSLQTVPITLLKKWLGHSRLSTTEIYAGAVGDEEQALAAQVWKSF